jgi:hypothetical protein
MEEGNKKVPAQAGGVGAVIIFFILLFVFAKWGPAINFSTTSQSKGEPFIVSGEGKVFVTPDIAKITLGIEDSGSSLKTVQNTVNTKSNTLTSALKKMDIAEGDIKTISYNVYPQRDYTSSTQRITGYQVSISYEVTIKDFDKVNDVMVTATTAGANIVGNVSFDLKDDTKTEKMNEARVKAVAAAKEKADGLAKAAGITLGSIVNVSESQGQDIRPVAYLDSKAAVGMGNETAIIEPNIQAGTNEITVTVALSYNTR